MKKIENETRKKIISVLKETGSWTKAARAVEKNRTTLFRWRKNDSEFDELTGNAIHEFNEKKSEEISDIESKLLATVAKLLDPPSSELTGLTTEHLFNKEGESTGFRIWETTKQVVKAPNVTLALKILEKVKREHSIKRISEIVIDDDESLSAQLIGKASISEQVQSFSSYLLDDDKDLFIIRLMQIQTQKLFDLGELSLSEHWKRSIELINLFQTTQDRIEARAKKKLEGFTYKEILGQKKGTINFIENLFKSIIEDTTIERNNIFEVYQKRRQQYSENK